MRRGVLAFRLRWPVGVNVRRHPNRTPRSVPPRFISRQLSHPTGAFARVMAWLMNRGNAKMNAFAVEQLELGPSDRVLEIGFGGGVALRSLVGRASFAGGVELSREMVEWAKAKYSAAVSAGRVVIGFLPKEWMDRLGYPSDIFTARTPNEIAAALTASGFKDVHIERPHPTTRWNVAVATR
jgi:arsenite methyltransferase